MNRLLLILIFTFSFQSLAKADDIRDFQVEGISIGDSLLDFFNENEIKNKIDRGEFFDQKSTYYESYFMKGKLDSYDVLKLTWKQNDDKYKIYGIAGMLFFPNNFNDCMGTQEKIVKEFEKLFPNIKKYNAGKKLSAYDPNKESYYIETNFTFKNKSQVRVYCSYWSDEMTKSNGWKHSLSVLINDFEFLEFLRQNY